MYFKEIIGHRDLKRRIRTAFRTGKLGHATMFTGKEGFGSLPIALALSRYVLCTNRNDDDACGKCPSCKKMDKLIHPDLHFVFPVINKKGKDPISDSYISDWRKFVFNKPYGSYVDWIKYIASENKQGGIFKDESDTINRKLSLKSFESDHKIMIIWMAEKMNDTAANKILKILEEPPASTIFILISVFPEQLLQTIISRTQVIPIPPIDSEDLVAYLELAKGLNEENANDLGVFSEGDLGRSLELIDRMDELNQNVQNFSYFLEYCKLQQTSDILRFIDTTLGKDKTAQIEFLNYILHTVRHNIIQSTIEKNSKNIGSKSLEKSVKINLTLVQAKTLLKMLTEALNHIERNVNARIVFMDVAIQLRKVLTV
ncbi:MAG: DNA polymerase III subunit delta [Salinivirgaceae bacterium]|nr:DNA polymerase III subunit delta [Salinivirgaceae bacterium]MDD4746115.1 DNA polymerase III subunit delta [Salinivirgaceae bacterium]